MFTDMMIAPCGLDCTLCSRALDVQKPCPGCLGPDDEKPGHCAHTCLVPRCEHRAKLPDRFCDLCARFPCPEILSLEIRYANQYPMMESPIGNLDVLRKQGMTAFLEAERARWTCPDCGAVICVHTGVCAGCGKAYNIRVLK